MISAEDCIALSGLDPELVSAIAEYNNSSKLCATGLTAYLITRQGGAGKIREMLVQDIHRTLNEGKLERAGELFTILRHFLNDYPIARVELGFERKALS